MKLPGFAAAAFACWGALSAAGCCCCAPRSCGDCSPHAIIDAAPCAPACAAPCPPPCEPCLTCGVNGPCPKHPGSRGLLGYLKDSLCCSSGCGEFYVHPWINDHPHPCDPCDDHGNWIGAHPCGPPACGTACPVSWRNLWGYRGDQGACCTSHGVPGPAVGHYDGEIIHGPLLQAPTPAAPRPMPSHPQELRGPDLPPMPPQLPGPTTQYNAPKTRSALKKVDGRPAVYYARRPQDGVR